MDDLQAYGWNDNFAAVWHELELDEYTPGRVIADRGSHLKVVTPLEYAAEIAGKLSHSSRSDELPKIGDWVALRLGEDNKATIHAVLPRQSEVSRRMAGDRFGKQILAANIDIAFVVQALDDDFSAARLERFIYQLRQSHIEPIFIFNKADLAQELAAKCSEVETLNIPYLITSAQTDQGLDQVAAAIPAGKTAVFLGSSGVGKSTLTNKLLGYERQKTAPVRVSDSTGMHTTSHRELFTLPNNGMIIDTPGIRELQLWGDETYLADTFPDIESLAADCKYRTTCSHSHEEGCKVIEAIQNKQLDPARLANYLKFQIELRAVSIQIAAQVEHDKAIHNKRAARARNFDDDEEY
ncbi:MAG: ribosome small subunit-dependent GTPase A [Candidatus Saccharibacteria bacterium]